MEHSASPSPATSERIRPWQVVLGFGVFFGLFTLASGIIPLITKWHSDSEITREVFDGMPDAFQVVFYLLLPTLIIYGAWNFSQRMRNWERGGPDNRSTTAANAKSG